MNSEFWGALLGAAVGGVTALLATQALVRAGSRQWREEALARGMSYLTGGRQARNVGIGLIQSLVASTDLPAVERSAVDQVFWGQLLYVAYQGDLSKPHEHANALRLLRHVSASEKRDKLEGCTQEKLEDIRSRIENEAN